MCSLKPALAQKFGYSSVDDFVQDSQKDFSLVESGLVNRAASRLLLVNVSQLNDSIWRPSDLALHIGDP